MCPGSCLGTLRPLQGRFAGGLWACLPKQERGGLDPPPPDRPQVTRRAETDVGVAISALHQSGLKPWFLAPLASPRAT